MLHSAAELAIEFDGYLMKIWRALGWIVAIVVIAAAVLFYMNHNKRYPSTDDAYVKANIVQIASQINGTVKSINTSDHAVVKKGQLLFQLDDRQEKLAVSQAQAQLQQAIQTYHANQMNVAASQAMVKEREAELVQAEAHAKRISALVKKKLYPPEQGDEATKQLNVARAALSASQKQLQQAKDELGKLGTENAALKNARAALAKSILNLSYTRVAAPADGYIANFNLRSGDQVSAYQNLFSIVADKEYWIEANFKETDVDRIKPGQSAKIKIDMYPEHEYHGSVGSISSGSGSSFSVLPPENASGNWIKVTQRFPIRINFKNINEFPVQLRVGSSAKVTVDTTQ